ncbi:MAG: secretin N-terminal domain-containing protein [Verrucomicrobia bacterium]|nr:secretin N-terminal domain-containing protein [Verrucomicrobiota bacterium]
MNSFLSYSCIHPWPALLVGLLFSVSTLTARDSWGRGKNSPGEWQTGESWKELEQRFDQVGWEPFDQRTAPAPTVDATPGIRSEPVDTEPSGLYSFKASGLDLKMAVALFAEANGLNIVVDHDVQGEVSMEVRKLPFRRIMQALLEANDCWWEEEGGLIRVRTRQTRLHQIDYLRLNRKGVGQNSATLAASSSGGGGVTVLGGGGGSGASTGGDAAGGSGGSVVNLSAENNIDFWKELRADVERLLTPEGRESLAINVTAGLIQITDRPSAQRRVERYLAGISQVIQRQIDIEARLYDVTLNDQFQFGIDWEQVVETSSGALTFGAAPSVVRPVGGFDMAPDSFNLVFQGTDTRVLLQALQEQGEVKVISKPRLRTLNNQTALIKVGTETPFFQNISTIVPGGGTTIGTSAVIEQDTVTSVTVGTILAITPQVAGDQWISLDISPVLTSLLETRVSPNRTTTAPVLDIKQASTLIRVRSGSTIILGGLIQSEAARSRRKIPGLGDVPLLGRLFQGDFEARRKKELVIFVTPRVVE